ncbi:MAG TPA: Coq4 family protein [Labilithrix sp.]|nr:Coq4 family protein [Labilithrix sp.]
MTRPSSHRTRPLVALRALAALAADPDDLPKVFTIIESLPGGSPDWMLARFKATDEGRKLLADRPDLGARLADRAALHALPSGSLGRAYAELMDREGITPAGIVAASMAGRNASAEKSDEHRFLADRMRDTHDLWHAVTGYGMDLLGEAALLCFIFPQTRSPGIALVALLGIVKAKGADRRIMRDGYLRGRKAAWLPNVLWEDLLARPVDEVRELLRVGPPPRYAPITTAALRASGDLAPRAVSA